MEKYGVYFGTKLVYTFSTYDKAFKFMNNNPYLTIYKIV